MREQYLFILRFLVAAGLRRFVCLLFTFGDLGITVRVDCHYKVCHTILLTEAISIFFILTLQMVEASEANSENARATNSSSYEATAEADGK